MQFFESAEKEYNKQLNGEFKKKKCNKHTEEIE